VSWLGVAIGGAGLLAALVLWTLVSSWRINRRWPPLGDRVEVAPGAGLQLCCTGSGPPVLLIHGAASNQRELRAAFEGHLGGLTVISVDRPGFGWSDRPDGCAAIGRQARLIGLALDRLACGPVVVAGHSWGSAVGLRLALDRPDLVRGMVCLAPASHPWPGGTGLANRIGATPVIGHLLAWTLPSLLGPLLANTGIARAFAPGPLMTGYGDLIGTPLHFRPGSFRANCQDMAAANRELAAQAPRYRTLAALPLAVISGAGDLIVSNMVHAKQLVRDLPNAISHRIDGAGHMPHWKDPALCATVIRQFAVGAAAAPQGQTQEQAQNQARAQAPAAK
jgi:pimeloyl-ACP methyl ester carboxylesterase